MGAAARQAAALLYAGDDAVLSHGTAAALWQLAPLPDEVTVTVAGRHVLSWPGLRVHRVACLDIRDVQLHHGFPVTSPARTVIDFAAVASDAALVEAVNEARVLWRVEDHEFHQAMDRCPLRAGVGRLRALLKHEGDRGATRSDAERRLRALIDQGRLPPPQFNQWLHGCLVDAVWRDLKVVVEADGFGPHGHRAKFESDRRRDQVLAAEGWVVVRITWRQLRWEPMAVLARLAQVLALARARAGVG